jgi:hypothetical protein
MSALKAVVSAWLPTREVRSIQDRDDRFDMFLGSFGEAVRHQIDCLRCCSSHGNTGSERLGLLVERQRCQVEAWWSRYHIGIYKSSSC